MDRQTLRLREKVLGKEHPNALTSMNNLAGLLKSQGKYTLTSRNQLASVLSSQCKDFEAEQMHRQTSELDPLPEGWEARKT